MIYLIFKIDMDLAKEACELLFEILFKPKIMFLNTEIIVQTLAHISRRLLLSVTHNAF